MKEAELNTIIRNTLLDEYRFGHKISDVGGGAQQRRPFDGLGLYEHRPVFWEAKIAQGVKAFNLKLVFEGERSHQMATFENIYQGCDASSRPHLWVPYGCYIPRAARVYIFDYAFLRDLYNDSTTSIHKKQLEEWQHTDIKKKRLTNIYVIGAGGADDS